MRQKKAKLFRKLTNSTSLNSESKKEIRKRYQKLKRGYKKVPGSNRATFIKQLVIGSAELAKKARILNETPVEN
jgi:hypothetical protein